MIYEGKYGVRPKVDIKMIDFAHSLSNSDKMKSNKTTEEREEGIVYVNYPPTKPGPDSGYLKGLKSLIECFESILMDK